MKKSLIFVAAAGAVMAAGCDPATGPGKERDIGIIEWRSVSASTFALNAGISAGDPLDEPVLAAPDTVQAGIAFDATVTTIGASGCWEADGASISVNGLHATITPYDLAPSQWPNGEPMFCTGALVRLPRTVTLTFGTPGEALLRVEGRVVVDGDLEHAEPIWLEQRIIVR